MRDVEVQKLMDTADELRKDGKYMDAIRAYLDALNLVKAERQDGLADDLWCKKAIFMACNGMGTAYSKIGKQMDAIDNFADAVLYAPTEEAKQVAKTNLEELQKALKEKTGVEFRFYPTEKK